MGRYEQHDLKVIGDKKGGITHFLLSSLHSTPLQSIFYFIDILNVIKNDKYLNLKQSSYRCLFSNLDWIIFYD